MACCYSWDADSTVAVDYCSFSVRFADWQVLVMKYLSAGSLVQLSAVNKDFHCIARQPLLWRRLHVKDFGRELIHMSKWFLQLNLLFLFVYLLVCFFAHLFCLFCFYGILFILIDLNWFLCISTDCIFLLVPVCIQFFRSFHFQFSRHFSISFIFVFENVIK